MELTSRMKDYYDLYFIAHTFDFDGRKLQEAIMQTLQNRGTDYDCSSFNEIISFSENDAMLVKWRQFIKRTKLPNVEFRPLYLTCTDYNRRPLYTQHSDKLY
jgi:hypothetical protein